METQNPPLTLDYVADFYRRYPGENVTLYAQVRVLKAISELEWHIVLPEGMTLAEFQTPPNCQRISSWTESEIGPSHIQCKSQSELPAGTSWEFAVQAQILHKRREERPLTPINLESTTQVKALTQTEQAYHTRAFVTISAAYQGRYIRYLPALYQADDLMGRYLMLFESFWAPIEKQIDGIFYYFDPHMTTLDFLPWLASWFNLALDNNLPEAQRRDMVQAAVSLYRMRGTKQGLTEYLEKYTGGQVRITEHRGHNFRLGPNARLGPALALGTENRPHTFTVHIQLPASAYVDGKISPVQQRKLQTLINQEKPAHSDYVLHIEPISPVD